MGFCESQDDAHAECTNCVGPCNLNTGEVLGPSTARLYQAFGMDKELEKFVINDDDNAEYFAQAADKKAQVDFVAHATAEPSLQTKVDQLETEIHDIRVKLDGMGSQTHLTQ